MTFSLPISESSNVLAMQHIPDFLHLNTKVVMLHHELLTH